MLFSTFIDEKYLSLPALNKYEIIVRKVYNMLIGRKKQQAELREAYSADESKFVALYGRRRVGKTYLVKQTFKDEFTFTHSGLANGSLQEQLYGWRSSLEDAGLSVS